MPSDKLTEKLSLLIILLLFSIPAFTQKLSFTVSMDNPDSHLFHVEFRYESVPGKKPVDFKLPVWSPGYYQKMNYPKNIENFMVFDKGGKEVKWTKKNNNTWSVENTGNGSLIITYDVLADRKFVANSYLDKDRGYIIPTSVFLHPAGKINSQVTVTIKPYTSWKNVATGLDLTGKEPFTYTAPDYDVLYDSPILIGNLEELPSFSVKGIPHYFIGFRLGEFNKVQFVNDLQKIVEQASGLIGDIPYKHYTFIAIGPGQGGIEHLNSTTISFDGASLNTPEGRIRVLNFIAHEYFHHYNVKRIRPIELGPFNYDNGNRTKMLWVSEGLTVYYEYLILKRAGITTDEELLNSFHANIMAFENKPGRHYQSLAQASYETWSDGPFGRTGDDVNKTISYYDKGPVVGMLLDFKIRNATQNQKSLDDVMRSLYQKYYQKEKRGFTEAEFRKTAEGIAKTPLSDIFEYISTTKELDYKKYFRYAGLDVDTATKVIQESWLGLSVRVRNDSAFVAEVDWDSPAWKSGLRRQDQILEINGQKVPILIISEIRDLQKTGGMAKVTFTHGGVRQEKEIVLTKRFGRDFKISLIPEATTLQKKIFADWTRKNK